MGVRGWSDVYSFTTESKQDQPFTFLFTTDSQAHNAAGNKIYGDLLSNALNEYPESRFILHGGDIVDDAALMSNGKVSLVLQKESLLILLFMQYSVTMMCTVKVNTSLNLSLRTLKMVLKVKKNGYIQSARFPPKNGRTSTLYFFYTYFDGWGE